MIGTKASGERLLMLEQQLATLRDEVQARIPRHPLSPSTVSHRLAKVDQSVGAADKTVPIIFLNGTYTEIAGTGSATYTNRQFASREVAHSITGETPPAGTVLLVYPWNDRWWFHWSKGGTTTITGTSSLTLSRPRWFKKGGPNDLDEVFAPPFENPYSIDLIDGQIDTDNLWIMFERIDGTLPGVTLNSSPDSLLTFTNPGLYKINCAALFDAARIFSPGNIVDHGYNAYIFVHGNNNFEPDQRSQQQIIQLTFPTDFTDQVDQGALPGQKQYMWPIRLSAFQLRQIIFAVNESSRSWSFSVSISLPFGVSDYGIRLTDPFVEITRIG